MKTNLIPCLLLASSLFVVAADAPAPAPSAQKIAVIDLRKAFDNYWKTKQADANLKEQAADLEKARNRLVDDYKKGQEAYKKQLDGANDPALSAEERDKRKKAAENELLALRRIEDDVKQFDNTSRTTLGEKQRRVRDQILSEIKDKIKARAKAGNYTMVIDTAAESINNTPFVLYTASSDNDLTDAILAELNLNAPKETPKDAPKDGEKRNEKAK
jgi:outer membrane protein